MISSCEGTRGRLTRGGGGWEAWPVSATGRKQGVTLGNVGGGWVGRQKGKETFTDYISWKEGPREIRVGLEPYTCAYNGASEAQKPPLPRKNTFTQ